MATNRYRPHAEFLLSLARSGDVNSAYFTYRAMRYLASRLRAEPPDPEACRILSDILEKVAADNGSLDNEFGLKKQARGGPKQAIRDAIIYYAVRYATYEGYGLHDETSVNGKPGAFVEVSRAAPKRMVLTSDTVKHAYYAYAKTVKKDQERVVWLPDDGADWRESFRTELAAVTQLSE